MKIQLFYAFQDLGFGHKKFCIDHNINDVVFLSDMRNEDFANDYGILHTNGSSKVISKIIVVTDSNHNIIYTQLAEQTGHN